MRYARKDSLLAELLNATRFVNITIISPFLSGLFLANLDIDINLPFTERSIRRRSDCKRACPMLIDSRDPASASTHSR
jgi:hypothetical protein